MDEGPRWWSIRPARNASGSLYRCPLCDGPIHAATDHLLIVPEGDASRRRHAHIACVRRARQEGRMATRAEREGRREPGALRRAAARLRRWFG